MKQIQIIVQCYVGCLCTTRRKFCPFPNYGNYLCLTRKLILLLLLSNFLSAKTTVPVCHSFIWFLLSFIGLIFLVSILLNCSWNKTNNNLLKARINYWLNAKSINTLLILIRQQHIKMNESDVTIGASSEACCVLTVAAWKQIQTRAALNIPGM